MADQFRTEIQIPDNPAKMHLQSRVLTLGSCFADVMGRFMNQYKMPVLVNPFGTLYNPLSVFRLLQACLAPEPNFKGGLVQRDGIWFAYDLHSSFYGRSQEELILKINEQLQACRLFLQKADVVVLTFGTALGYVHQATDQLVANCHKVPQKEFSRHLLSLDQMQAEFSQLWTGLQEFNPNLRLVLTVSPVRHLKETLELNSVSKSLLRVLCHELSQNHPEISYFPAYEIMLDDLRDYRFYGADMIHPSPVAEAYIWEKFSQANFHPEFIQFTVTWDKLRHALAHRPFHPESAAHQEFLTKTLNQLKKLQSLVDCQPEIDAIKAQLLPR